MVMMPSENVFVRYIINITVGTATAVLQNSYIPMVSTSTTRPFKNSWDRWASKLSGGNSTIVLIKESWVRLLRT